MHDLISAGGFGLAASISVGGFGLAASISVGGFGLAASISVGGFGLAASISVLFQVLQELMKPYCDPGTKSSSLGVF